MTANDAFDAGITALGRDDYPTAIASLLVAREAAPRDPEIGRALEAARTASGSQVHVAPPFPVSATDLALLLVLVNLALCVVIGLRARRGVLVTALVVWALTLAAWAARAFTQPEYVVITQPDTRTYAANDADSLERYRVSLGDELVLEGRSEGWLKVSGPEGPAYVPAQNALETTHLGSTKHR